MYNRLTPTPYVHRGNSISSTHTGKSLCNSHAGQVHQLQKIEHINTVSNWDLNRFHTRGDNLTMSSLLIRQMRKIQWLWSHIKSHHIYCFSSHWVLRDLGEQSFTCRSKHVHPFYHVYPLSQYLSGVLRLRLSEVHKLNFTLHLRDCYRQEEHA